MYKRVERWERDQCQNCKFWRCRPEHNFRQTCALQNDRQNSEHFPYVEPCEFYINVYAVMAQNFIDRVVPIAEEFMTTPQEVLSHMFYADTDVIEE